MTDGSKPPVKVSTILKTALEMGPVATLRCLLSTFRVALKGTAALQADNARPGDHRPDQARGAGPPPLIKALARPSKEIDMGLSGFACQVRVLLGRGTRVLEGPGAGGQIILGG